MENIKPIVVGLGSDENEYEIIQWHPFEFEEKMLELQEECNEEIKFIMKGNLKAEIKTV